MLSFLFWNLKRVPPKGTLQRLVLRHDVDVLMLAECPLGVTDVLAELNRNGTDFYHNSAKVNPGNPLRLYSRFDDQRMVSVQDGYGMTCRELNPPGRRTVLLAIVHLSSKMHESGQSQAFSAIEYSRDIQDLERRLGHQRTIVVGDFNVNPFESGVVAASGFNAVMDRRTARRGTRGRLGREYPHFYNPMWGLFGDGTRGPPGTYYRTDSDQVCYYWNMFDQVLIRPDLLDSFKNEYLYIVESDGMTEFRTAEGLPDKHISDHLPIVFKLDL